MRGVAQVIRVTALQTQNPEFKLTHVSHVNNPITLIKIFH
jgi:hypothetical protein